MLSYAIRYLRFYLCAGDAHTIHSPFVYQLYTQVIRAAHHFTDCEAIEQLRQELLQDRTLLHVEDLGAGSRKNNLTHRRVADLARYSASTPKKAQLLFRLVNYFKPKVIVELGTSLGISTLYLAKASTPDTQIITLEGSLALAEKAREHFEELDVENVESIIGNIDTTLQATLNSLDRLDFVFIDANHRKEPTLRYFNSLLHKIHNDTVLIFDDIHWSDEMTQAWEQIRQHHQVSVSIDLFWVGLIFFRREQPKQHFRLRF